MKTEISNFCKDYAAVLAPLAGSLNETIRCIQKESHEGILKIPLTGLADVKHRLKTLFDKIEGQQAYLLIFGPLKSGKSTLMNAISGSYVSEVTSLPAYPCLVYVSHSDNSRYSVTRYNGRKNSFTEGNIVQALVNDSHANLADRIRLVEEQGASFDPGMHYPEAIRRIDIEIPAKNLQESSTVLVDTPGLYSRMKFGYDLMTREFR
ncbi:MAG TPA: hypothetical protein EYG38_17080, partial [Verrucomicrobia bacterium]|nr:hypothetical protein [Verrucomicrobiota bacterium]